MVNASSRNKIALVLMVVAASFLVRVSAIPAQPRSPLIAANELSISGVTLDWKYEQLIERFGPPVSQSEDVARWESPDIQIRLDRNKIVTVSGASLWRNGQLFLERGMECSDWGRYFGSSTKPEYAGDYQGCGFSSPEHFWFSSYPNSGLSLISSEFGVFFRSSPVATRFMLSRFESPKTFISYGYLKPSGHLQ